LRVIASDLLLMPIFRKSYRLFQDEERTDTVSVQCTPRPNKVNGKIDHEVGHGDNLQTLITVYSRILL